MVNNKVAIHKLLLVEEAGYSVYIYGNSWYYLHNFSINSKLLKNKMVIFLKSSHINSDKE